MLFYVKRHVANFIIIHHNYFLRFLAVLAPYFDENPTLESVVKSIWVVPPNENKQAQEYGRPMLMQYSVLPDKEIPEEVRTEIQACVDYYSQFRNEIVKFTNIFSEDTSYIEKLKNTLYPKFPVKQNDKALWNWLCAVLDCEQEDDFIPPKTIKIIDIKDEVKSELTTVLSADIKLEEIKFEQVQQSLTAAEEAVRRAEEESQQAAEQKASELKVLSLQVCGRVFEGRLLPKRDSDLVDLTFWLHY